VESLREKDAAYELFFSDEMRYGLISNFRRSWSKVGERTIIDSQQSFDNRYLFSAVSPLSGESFHLTGIDGFDAAASHTFLLELKKKYPNKMVVVVWDNAPCHRPKIHREIPGLIVLFLPPYSPQLNPCERFFEELRKATANQIFKTIEAQEKAIDAVLNTWADNLKAMKQLLGYSWILEQCGRVS
jgi:transposase